jgi:putative hydrolases of HD superfamily
MKESLLEALRLKQVSRAGWLRVGIENPESVADHSWGVALLALALCPADLDLSKVLALAIVHDLPEVRAGDITPYDGVSGTEKRRLEAAAAEAMLPSALREIWLEYDAGTTPESRFVHMLDKLEMGLQALNYTATADVTEFLDSAKKTLTPGWRRWLERPET